MTLSVVIPARNEAASVGETLAALGARLRAGGVPHELLVVDDGSTDGTADVVVALAREHAEIRLVPNPGLHGFGRAVVRGLDAARGDAVVIAMADGSDDPDDVVRYYEILRDRAECAFGSRFVTGARVAGYPWPKLVLNRLANTAIRWLFGLALNDVTNAFKGYRRQVLDGCRPLLAPHFNLTVELPLKAIVRGYTWETIPIAWRGRRGGTSSFRVKEMGSRYLYIILVIWLERLLTREDYRRRAGPARPPQASS